MLSLHLRTRPTLRTSHARHRAWLEVERLETRAMPALILGGSAVLLPDMPDQGRAAGDQAVSMVRIAPSDWMTPVTSSRDVVEEVTLTEERVVLIIVESSPAPVHNATPTLRADVDDHPVTETVVTGNTPAADPTLLRDTVHAEERAIADAHAAMDTIPVMRPAGPSVDAVPKAVLPVNGGAANAAPAATPAATPLDAVHVPVSTSAAFAAAPIPSNPPTLVRGDGEHVRVAESDTFSAGVPGPAEVVVASNVPTGSSTGDFSAPPWLAGIVTPVLSSDLAEPLQALRGVVVEAQGWGEALLGKLTTLISSPWIAGAIGMVTAGAVLRRQARRKAHAQDVPEITAPRQLT